MHTVVIPSLLLMLLVAASCAPSHETAAREVDDQDCVVCHREDYEATQNPVHPGNFPETCGDCHSTTGWVPALGGLHPEARFPINSGPHDPFLCLDCHDPDRGPSTDGQNTDCIGCHTGKHDLSKMNEEHDDEEGYVPDPDRPNFCLDCHPNGRKEDD